MYCAVSTCFKVRTIPTVAIWQAKSTEDCSGPSSSEDFDAVFVANGHYYVPYIPEIPGQPQKNVSIFWAGHCINVGGINDFTHSAAYKSTAIKHNASTILTLWVLGMLPGSHDFSGLQMHSFAYRTPEVFAGMKRVLVIGAHPSGLDIGFQASTVTDEV